MWQRQEAVEADGVLRAEVAEPLQVRMASLCVLCGRCRHSDKFGTWWLLCASFVDDAWKRVKARRRLPPSFSEGASALKLYVKMRPEAGRS